MYTHHMQTTKNGSFSSKFKYFSTVTIHQGEARISYIAEGLIVKSLNSDSLMNEILLDY